MSVYNGEKYLGDAIESILTQTYRNYEFIIIDDGSTDKSLEIIKKYMKTDKRIVLISRKNKGLPYSLNEGIRLSKGKYIARMDADDISLPARLEEQVTFMKKNIDIGVCGCSILDMYTEKEWILSSFDKRLKTELLFSSIFAHPSVMIRKELIINHDLFYNESFLQSQDFELWTRMAKYTKFSNLKVPLLKYRTGEGSITSEANKDIEQRYAIHKKIFNPYLNELELENTEEENRLHFNISLHKRIKENDIDFKALENYFDKLLLANKNIKIFDTLELKKILGKKWLVNMYYRKRFSKIFSKYFLYGSLGVIQKWIR